MVLESDLRTISGLNDIFKYEDDWCLSDLNMEFNHIKQWAATDGLIINSNRTKEHVDCSKLLGVMFQNNCKMDSRVQYILSQCAQRIYLLKLLQHKECLVTY